MIGRIKCWFGNHDEEIIPVSVTYCISYRPDMFTMEQINDINAAFHRSPKKTYYYRCKRCGTEKEVGT